MAHSEDVVVVANGAVLAGLALASPADFIRESAPRGAYTAGRAEFGKGMGWWSAHLARLRRSLRAMRERDPGCFELGSEIPADDETLATWVAPSVKLALDAIDAKTLANAKPCDAVKPPKQAKQHCVVIIVAPAPSGYNVFVHASPLQIRVDEFYRGVDVAVLGPPRRNPAAKDTNWVRDRRQLEARKREAAADEVLLADDDGEVLLEGLVTNLFVVVETENPGGGHLPRRHAAFTAPTTRCLPGLARQAVLDALDAEGIPWDERAPTASERSEWSEAFVTNAVKLARPVRTLRWPRGIPGKLEVEFGPCAGSGEKPRGDSEWKNEVKCELDASPGPVCQAVLRRLNASMASDVGPAR